jgi:hypothetical protein
MQYSVWAADAAIQSSTVFRFCWQTVPSRCSNLKLPRLFPRRDSRQAYRDAKISLECWNRQLFYASNGQQAVDAFSGSSR